MDRWMTAMERNFLGLGLRLVHDGRANPGQFALRSEDIKYYSMVYENGKVAFRIIYDIRDTEKVKLVIPGENSQETWILEKPSLTLKQWWLKVKREEI